MLEPNQTYVDERPVHGDHPWVNANLFSAARAQVGDDNRGDGQAEARLGFDNRGVGRLFFAEPAVDDNAFLAKPAEMKAIKQARIQERFRVEAVDGALSSLLQAKCGLSTFDAGGPQLRTVKALEGLRAERTGRIGGRAIRPNGKSNKPGFESASESKLGGECLASWCLLQEKRGLSGSTFDEQPNRLRKNKGNKAGFKSASESKLGMERIASWSSFKLAAPKVQFIRIRRSKSGSELKLGMERLSSQSWSNLLPEKCGLFGSDGQPNRWKMQAIKQARIPKRLRVEAVDGAPLLLVVIKLAARKQQAQIQKCLVINFQACGKKVMKIRLVSGRTASANQQSDRWKKQEAPIQKCLVVNFQACCKKMKIRPVGGWTASANLSLLKQKCGLSGFGFEAIEIRPVGGWTASANLKNHQLVQKRLESGTGAHRIGSSLLPTKRLMRIRRVTRLNEKATRPDMKASPNRSWRCSASLPSRGRTCCKKTRKVRPAGGWTAAANPTFAEGSKSSDWLLHKSRPITG
ncbi:hypothetical protein C8R43DRAFT_951905 [Mycena crocata]|nr:hypothetical protein C8R43DRAFT_951905 [Mycena crocata]